MYPLFTPYRYYLYPGPTDMRKGFHSLEGIVRNLMDKNPLTGDLFVFINKRKNQLKLLGWCGDGFAIYHKKLACGTFEIPLPETGNNTLEIPLEKLQFIMSGIQLSSVLKRKRFSF